MTDILLALSGTHLAVLNPEKQQEYAFNAIRYQNRALMKFREALQDPTRDNCLALFTFSSMLGVVHMGLARVRSPDVNPCYAIDTICHLAGLWRGSRSLLNRCREILGQCGYEMNFTDHVTVQRRAHLDEDLCSHSPQHFKVDEPVERYLAQLERDFEIPEEPGIVQEENKLLQSAIFELRLIQSRHGAERPVILLAWPVCVDEAFHYLVQEGHEGALAILGCLGFCLLRIHDRWFATDVGIDLIRESAARSTDKYSDMFERLLKDAEVLLQQQLEANGTAGQEFKLQVD